MRKLLFIITTILFCGTVSAQYFPVTPTTYGGNNLRGKFSVALLFPTGTGAPASLTNTSVDVTQAAFYFDKTAGKGYVWNPTTAQWDGVFGSGISNVWKQVNDTISLVSSPYKKIGINTPSPQAVFHVKSNDLNDQIIVQNMNTSGQSAYQYRDNSGETFRANIRATGFGNTGFTAYPGIGYDVMSNFKTDDGIIPDKVFAESLIRNTTIITRYTDRWGGTGGAKQFLHERYDSSGGVTYRNNKQNGDTYIKGTLTNDNLSASKVAVSDGTKALTSSAVNTTELAQLIGISTASTIQAQLNAKGVGTVINVAATSLSSNLAITVTGPTGNVAITALVSPNQTFSSVAVSGGLSTGTITTTGIASINSLTVIGPTLLTGAVTTGGNVTVGNLLTAPSLFINSGSPRLANSSASQYWQTFIITNSFEYGDWYGDGGAVDHISGWGGNSTIGGVTQNKNTNIHRTSGTGGRREYWYDATRGAMWDMNGPANNTTSYMTFNASPNAGNAFQANPTAGNICFLSNCLGTSSFSGYWQVAGNFAGSITHPTNTTTNYNVTSDYRLKENVQTLKNGLRAIMQLRPVTGNYIADPMKTNMAMFIAHEVQKVIPIAVTGEKDAMKLDKVTGKLIPDIQQLDAIKIIPYLVSSIQELTSIVLRQRRQTTTQAKRITALEKLIKK